MYFSAVWKVAINDNNSLINSHTRRLFLYLLWEQHDELIPPFFGGILQTNIQILRRWGQWQKLFFYKLTTYSQSKNNYQYFKIDPANRLISDGSKKYIYTLYISRKKFCWISCLELLLFLRTIFSNMTSLCFSCLWELCNLFIYLLTYLSSKMFCWVRWFFISMGSVRVRVDNENRSCFLFWLHF